MKLLVVSDSHGSYESLYKIVTSNADADVFIHLGDGECEFDRVYTLFGGQTYYVRGNNDYQGFHAVQCAELGGHRLFITHGHNYDVRLSTDFIYSSAVVNNCDIALFGHTHVALYEKREKVHIFNPGSCYCPRGGAAPTYGIITIDGDRVEFEHRFV